MQGVANYDAAVAVMDAFRSPELWTPSVAEDAAVQAEKLAREQRRQAAWMEQQPEAALDWVKSQPDSESKTKALEVCIVELAKTDFTEALALAGSLPEGTWRSTVVADLFNDWAARDPEGAMNWLENLGLPPEIMQARREAVPW